MVHSFIAVSPKSVSGRDSPAAAPQLLVRTSWGLDFPVNAPNKKPTKLKAKLCCSSHWPCDVNRGQTAAWRRVEVGVEHPGEVGSWSFAWWHPLCQEGGPPSAEAMTPGYVGALPAIRASSCLPFQSIFPVIHPAAVVFCCIKWCSGHLLLSPSPFQGNGMPAPCFISSTCSTVFDVRPCLWL